MLGTYSLTHLLTRDLLTYLVSPHAPALGRWASRDHGYATVDVDDPPLLAVSSLLGVPVASLATAVASRWAVVHGDTDDADAVRIPLLAAEAAEQVDELGRTLYYRLVTWLARSVEEAVAAASTPATAQGRTHDELRTISLVDFAGLDVLVGMGAGCAMEALLTNFAHERLRAFMLGAFDAPASAGASAAVAVGGRDEAEGEQASESEAILRVLCGSPYAILHALSNHSRRAAATDDDLFADLSASLPKSARWRPMPAGFAISHYGPFLGRGSGWAPSGTDDAGVPPHSHSGNIGQCEGSVSRMVEYCGCGWLQADRMAMPAHLESLLAESPLALVRNLASPNFGSAPAPRRRQRGSLSRSALLHAGLDGLFDSFAGAHASVVACMQLARPLTAHDDSADRANGYRDGQLDAARQLRSIAPFALATARTRGDGRSPSLPALAPYLKEPLPRLSELELSPGSARPVKAVTAESEGIDEDADAGADADAGGIDDGGEHREAVAQEADARQEARTSLLGGVKADQVRVAKQADDRAQQPLRRGSRDVGEGQGSATAAVGKPPNLLSRVDAPPVDAAFIGGVRKDAAAVPQSHRLVEANVDGQQVLSTHFQLRLWSPRGALWTPFTCTLLSDDELLLIHTGHPPCKLRTHAPASTQPRHARHGLYCLPQPHPPASTQRHVLYCLPTNAHGRAAPLPRAHVQTPPRSPHR